MSVLLSDFSIFTQTFPSLFIPLFVLGMSLAGSWHCAGMCGGLITATTPGKSSMIGYQAGRLFSYEILGIIFGLFGKYTLSNLLSGIFPLLVSLALGISFIIIGISRGRKSTFFLSSFFSRFYSKLVGRAIQNSSSHLLWRGFKIGSLSVFLPCGWLYSFILAAVLTQNPYYSGALLFFFWLGSIPALTLAPTLIRKLFEPISRRFPKFSALVFIAIGLFTIGIKIYPILYPTMNREALFCPLPPKAAAVTFFHSSQSK